MKKTKIKLPLATLVLSLLLPFPLFATQIAEPEPEPVPTETEVKTTEDKETAENTTDTAEETTEEQAPPKSPIVDVTPYEMYMTDQLSVFIHSGSNKRYRMVARVPAREKVTVTAKDENTGWVKIKLKNNKTGWVDAKMLTQTAGVQAKLDAANAQIKQLKVQMSKLGKVSTDDLQVLEEEITQLTEKNEALSKQLLTVTNENAALIQSSKDSDETKRILAKLYDVGGIVIGVFVGWLLTRTRKQRW